LVKSFAIGGTGGSDLRFLVDTHDAAHYGDTIAGRLSPDILQNFDLDFDFAGNKLNLFAPEHCPGRVVYWTNSYAQIPFKTPGTGQILMIVTLDGQSLRAAIDTGAAVSFLNAAMANLAFGVNENTPGIERNPGAQPNDLVQYRYHFKSLLLNGIEVHNPLLYLLQDKSEDAIKKQLDKAGSDPVNGVQSAGPRIFIGRDILRQLHVYIAYGEKNMYVSSAGPNPAASTAKPAGN
jgi:hypothetical protein